MEASLEQQRAAALARRDRLLARITFWEHWRAVLTLPLILLAAGAGWLIGSALRGALHFPERTEAFGAVIAIVLLGQGLHAFFHVRRLEAARHRVDALDRQLRRRDS